jgi:hypothetical protein
MTRRVQHDGMTNHTSASAPPTNGATYTPPQSSSQTIAAAPPAQLGAWAASAAVARASRTWTGRRAIGKGDRRLLELGQEATERQARNVAIVATVTEAHRATAVGLVGMDHTMTQAQSQVSRVAAAQRIEAVTEQGEQFLEQLMPQLFADSFNTLRS